jgi:hypothetical protein
MNAYKYIKLHAQSEAINTYLLHLFLVLVSVPSFIFQLHHQLLQFLFLLPVALLLGKSLPETMSIPITQ